MKRHSVEWILAATCVLACSQVAAQTSTSTEQLLKGVWRIAEVSDPSEPLNRSPQPSQIIFTKTHYSYIAINQARPKLAPPANPGKLTDAEKIARYEHWFAMTAHSGTYDVEGSVLTFQPAIAKNAAVMGGTERFEVKSDGPALLLVSQANKYTLKLERLE